jgi:hypothetical protein
MPVSDNEDGMMLKHGSPGAPFFVSISAPLRFFSGFIPFSDSGRFMAALRQRILDPGADVASGRWKGVKPFAVAAAQRFFSGSAFRDSKA